MHSHWLRLRPQELPCASLALEVPESTEVGNKHRRTTIGGTWGDLPPSKSCSCICEVGMGTCLQHEGPGHPAEPTKGFETGDAALLRPKTEASPHAHGAARVHNKKAIVFSTPTPTPTHTNRGGRGPAGSRREALAG